MKLKVTLTIDAKEACNHVAIGTICAFMKVMMPLPLKQLLTVDWSIIDIEVVDVERLDYETEKPRINVFVCAVPGCMKPATHDPAGMLRCGLHK